MALAMPANQPIYGLRPINLDGADVNLSVEQLAADYLRQICNVQARGPYRLAGYSIGAILAYEMATVLVDRGEEVGLLALMDARAQPKFQQRLSSAEWRQFRTVYLADRIRKYGRNLSQGRIDHIWSDVRQYVEKIRPIAWKITQRVCQKLGCSMPSFVHSRSLMFSAMLRSYAPKEFTGRLVLFRPEERTPAEDVDPYYGWHKYAKNGVDLHFVPGSHGTMMQMPTARVLADKLVPYLKY